MMNYETDQLPKKGNVIYVHIKSETIVTEQILEQQYITSINSQVDESRTNSWMKAKGYRLHNTARNTKLEIQNKEQKTMQKILEKSENQWGGFYFTRVLQLVHLQ